MTIRGLYPAIKSHFKLLALAPIVSETIPSEGMVS